MFGIHLTARRVLTVALSVALLVTAAQWSTRAAESAVVIPPPSMDDKKGEGNLQTAVLAGGCFWGVQGVFEHVKGVRRVLSGYAGGEKSTADYETVGTGSTGHAESVQITYDPREVSYGTLLQIYFSVAHDPTQLNRQGPDSGSQYRSAIFVTDDAQRKVADSYIAQLNQAHVFAAPIVTRVDSLRGFYPAEAYHQDFLINNPRHPYIVFNDLPKIRNLQRVLPQLYRDAPVTVSASLTR